MAKKDLLLDRSELTALRNALRDSGQDHLASLWLLCRRPQMSRWLTPRQGADVMRLGLTEDVDAAALLACVDAMSPAVARAALAACPELLLAEPMRLLAQDGTTDSQLLKALFMERGAGAWGLHQSVLAQAGGGLSRAAVRSFYEGVGDAGLYDILHDGWKRGELELRLLCLEMLARDRSELEAAITKRPIGPDDDPALSELLSELRSLHA
jgi:hypothetical protein